MAKNNRRGSVEKPDLSVLGPIAEIIRLVKAGKRTKRQLQAFIEGRNPFEVFIELEIDDAITILGESKIITCDQMCEAFGQAGREYTPAIRYTKETLCECAAWNSLGLTDWRLVYSLPLSLRYQREIIGVNPNTQPCFEYKDWWLGFKEHAWATSEPKVGYYLIDMKGRFNRTNWNDQNARITEMGEQYERADERVFAQALVSIFKTHGQRLHSGTYHWGLLEDSGGYRVYVGDFVSDSLFVYHALPSGAYDGLFVCVARKWDL